MKTMTRTMMVVASVCMALATGCTADIRPDELKGVERPKASAESKDRTLLERAAQVHGVSAWKDVETYTVVLNDEWRGMMPKMINPWPEPVVDVRMSYRAGSFDGRAEFLEGDEKGTIWGMQSWKTYEVENGGDAQFVDNDDARFMLPAIQYLMEFPFRDHSGQLVSYIGTEEVGGKVYDRVFLTWNSLDPSPTADQYIVYIDPDTGRIDKLHYTAREMMKFAKGTIHFEDVRSIDGVLVPFTQVVTNSVHDPQSKFAHKITLSSFEANTPTGEVFDVNPKLARSGDTKPMAR